MVVVSVDGLANDGVDYDMWLERPHSQPALRLEMVEAEGADPRVARARRQALTMQLHVRVYGDSAAETAALREALLAALDTEDAAVALVVADDDGGNERYRMVVAQTPGDEQPESEGLGQHYVATLVTHGETRWRANTATQVTWDVTGSGALTAVTNGGTLPARPRYTFRPTAARGGSENRWAWRQFWAVRWTSPFERRRYPINVTNGFWDSEALVDGGEIYAPYGEDNVAVLVDGVEVRRWLEGYDTATTSVWVNLDFAPSAETGLLTSIGSGDTVSQIEANRSIDAFPSRGMLLINDEVFTYGAKDNVRQVFLDVTRATKGTTAVDHTGGVSGVGHTIYWLQHEVWLVYGGAGFHQLADFEGRPYDAYKPMVDMANSFNDFWSFAEFGQDGAEYAGRAAMWRKNETPGHWALAGGDPWTNISVARASQADMPGYVDEEGLPDRSWWSLNAVAYPVGEVTAVGSSIAYEEAAWDVRVDVAQGSQYQAAIPQPGVYNEFEAFDVTADLATGFAVEEMRFIQECRGGMQSVLYSLTAQFTDAPVVYPSVAEEVYSTDVELANVTTGLAFTLRTELALEDEIEVDTEARTVRRASDGENVYYALERSTRRGEILPLAPGVNTLRVTEEGLAGMTVVIEFEERTYS